MWPIVDEKVITCPNCKSIFIIEGATFPGSPKYQEIYCPVCGQKIIVNTVRFLGLGRMWYPKKVLKRNPAPPLPSRQSVALTKATSLKPAKTEEERKKEEERAKREEEKSKIMPDWLKPVLIAGGIILGGLVLIELLGD